MSQVIGEHYPEPEISEITHEHGDSPTEQSEQNTFHACAAVLGGHDARFACSFNGGGRRKRLFDSSFYGS